jgi:hypothetical protein
MNHFQWTRLTVQDITEQTTINMTDEQKILLQDFTRRLNAEPDPREFDKTPDGKANTLPISFVEMTLDELFMGQWDTINFKYEQVFNEVIGSLELIVINPVTDRPTIRTGAASVIITQDEGAKLADFNMTKKKNAMDLTFPKLKAECTKNAAQTLGKIFGRDINRKSRDVFKPALRTLSDEGFKSLVARLDAGDFQALTLARGNFLLDDTQKAILDGYDTQPKQLGK